MNIGIIGLGYWGPNYIRLTNELIEINLLYLCDKELERLKKYRGLIKENVKLVTDYHEVFKDPEVKAVIVTTPPNTHYQIVKDALEQGLHVLVEKPLTLSIESALELADLAKKRRRVLLVGHVYLFNPGFRELKRMLDQNELGEPVYGFSLRLGLGPIRKSASALWDLAIHDVYIVMDMLKKVPEEVIASGESYIQSGVADFVNLTLNFSEKQTFSIYCSWVCPEKIRKLTVVGRKKMVTFDDVNKTEMLKVYNQSFALDLLDSTPAYVDHQLIIKQGDVVIPYIKQIEPLKAQLEHFINCVKGKEKPLADGFKAAQVIKVLTQAEKSLHYKKVMSV